MFRREKQDLLITALKQMEQYPFAEDFLDDYADFFIQHLGLFNMCVLYLETNGSQFKVYPSQQNSSWKGLKLDKNSNLPQYLDQCQCAITLKDLPKSRTRVVHKDLPDPLKNLEFDMVVPIQIQGNLKGFLFLKNPRRSNKIALLEDLFFCFNKAYVPLIENDRIKTEDHKNYYKIYRMDRLAKLGELAAISIHEIKNPLAGLSSYLKYFSQLDSFSDSEIQEDLLIMEDSIQRIHHMIKSLLSFSRHRKEKIEEIDLDAAVETTLKSLALKISENIETQITIESPCLIQGDWQIVQQILINLIMNSLDALSDQKGAIRIATTKKGEPEDSQVQLMIQDTGPGIKPEILKKLFQPFQTTKEEGTGLGLFTCRGLMKNMGGNIQLSSSPQGTRVTLTFKAPSAPTVLNG